MRATCLVFIWRERKTKPSAITMRVKHEHLSGLMNYCREESLPAHCLNLKHSFICIRLFHRVCASIPHLKRLRLRELLPAPDSGACRIAVQCAPSFTISVKQTVHGVLQLTGRTLSSTFGSAACCWATWFMLMAMQCKKMTRTNGTTYGTNCDNHF